MSDKDVLVEARELTKHFPVRRGVLRRIAANVSAVERVNLHIYRGETLGLVGESGCGKSTLGRLLLALLQPTRGEVLFRGQDLTALSSRELKAAREHMQIVFQDPASSLNPRLTCGQIIEEGLAIHRRGRRTERSHRVEESLERVGLRSEIADRYPHELSGGQRQRVSIARALVLNPMFVVADEVVSALDVSVQAQVLNLLMRLRRELELTYLFIGHDLAVVAYVADRIAVMYLGKVVEVAGSERLLEQPLHPYTAGLLSAIPNPQPGTDKRRSHVGGDIPSPVDPPSGCRFRTRCPAAQEVCAQREPPLEEHEDGHWAACHFAAEGVAKQILQERPGG
jgi:oligopeptide transport system ATP-binding protein